jgi:hypothetical protein
MRPPLELPTARHYWHRIVWIYVMVTPFAAMAGGQAALDFGRPERFEMVLGLSGVAAFLLLVPTVLLLARRRWVARMDHAGVVLRNGRRFAWADFRGVEPVRNRRLRFVNHYDLVFTGGRAGVFHHMVANPFELENVLHALAHGENPFTAPLVAP